MQQKLNKIFYFLNECFISYSLHGRFKFIVPKSLFALFTLFNASYDEEAQPCPGKSFQMSRANIDHSVLLTSSEQFLLDDLNILPPGVRVESFLDFLNGLIGKKSVVEDDQILGFIPVIDHKLFHRLKSRF